MAEPAPGYSESDYLDQLVCFLMAPAVILHDILEDTNVTEEQFGVTIEQYVSELDEIIHRATDPYRQYREFVGKYENLLGTSYFALIELTNEQVNKVLDEALKERILADETDGREIN